MAPAVVLLAVPATPASPFLRASVLTHVPLHEHTRLVIHKSHSKSLLKGHLLRKALHTYAYPTPFPGLFTSIAFITTYFSYLVYCASFPTAKCAPLEQGACVLFTAVVPVPRTGCGT